MRAGGRRFGRHTASGRGEQAASRTRVCGALAVSEEHSPYGTGLPVHLFSSFSYAAMSTHTAQQLRGAPAQRAGRRASRTAAASRRVLSVRAEKVVGIDLGTTNSAVRGQPGRPAGMLGRWGGGRPRGGRVAAEGLARGAAGRLLPQPASPVPRASCEGRAACSGGAAGAVGAPARDSEGCPRKPSGTRLLSGSALTPPAPGGGDGGRQAHHHHQRGGRAHHPLRGGVHQDGRAPCRPGAQPLTLRPPSAAKAASACKVSGKVGWARRRC